MLTAPTRRDDLKERCRLTSQSEVALHPIGDMRRKGTRDRLAASNSKQRQGDVQDRVLIVAGEQPLPGEAIYIA
jgi:hypothetical protein